MTSQPFKLIIAGGKTGGHLFPGIAIAQALERLSQNARILFVGTDAPFEVNTLNAYGYDHKAIYSKPIKGGSILSKLFSLSVIIISMFQSLIIMKSIKPDFVIGVGGFSSFAVVLSAWLLGIPTAIQEQNAIPGITNRMLSKFARTIFTSFKDTKGFSHLPKTQFVGNPVRSGTDAESAKFPACAELDTDRPTLLITGGSQGAASINTAVVDALTKMNMAGQLNIIHQTGITDETFVKGTYKAHQVEATVQAFFKDMPQFIRKADLVIARSGAGTLSELAAMGKPAILIPFPHAADDHQTANAQNLVDAKAAVMIQDKALTGKILRTEIESLLSNEEQLKRMGKAMQSLAMPDADKIIATHILETQAIKG